MVLFVYMSDITIRRAYEQDTNPIYNLVPELAPLTYHTRYTYWNLFRNFGNVCFVALDQDQPVGFITSHPTTTPENEWFIWQAGIVSEFRGKGLIDKLQDRVVSIARESGAIALTTSIESDNPRSLGAFTRMAIRLGTSIEEISRFNLDSEDKTSAPEVLYRIPLQS